MERSISTAARGRTCQFKPWLKPLLALSVSAAAMAPALAQGQEQQRRSALMEEVMVTAQKRQVAEAAQDVPIAINAFSGDKVAAMFAVDLQDVGRTAPNVNLAEQGTVPHTGNFIIRGMGTAGQSIPSSDPAVGVVQDGMPFGLIYGVVTDLFDLESIEILRGPQGTLFGRNVTGGAVVMRTTRPSDEFEGRVRATVGSHKTRNLSAMVTGPLNDNWNGKLAVMYKDRDGLWDRDGFSGRLGEEETIIIRPAIQYTADTWDLTLIGDYADIQGDGMRARNFFRFGEDIGAFSDNKATSEKKGDLDMEWYSLVLEHNWDLWGGLLTTIVGYRDLEQLTWGDIDGLPFSARFEFAEGSGIEQDQWTLESRWSGDLSERLNLTVGISLFSQEYTYNERRLLIDLFDSPASSTIEHDTAGLFAQAHYDLTPELMLTLGGRFSWEKKDAAIGVIGAPGNPAGCETLINMEELATGVPLDTPPDFPGAPPPFDRQVNWSACPSHFEDDESWTSFTPKIGLTWYIHEDLMTYASFTGGFRSGGYNVRFADASVVTNPDNPTSVPGPYDEEEVLAWEVGFKSEWFDGRLRFNGALFWNEYDDLQRSINNRQGVQTILNAADARVRGVELDVIALLTERLTLEASYGHTDEKYESADAFLRDPGFPEGKSISDLDFQMVPSNTFSASLTYEHEVGDMGYLNWRGSYSFVDEAASDTFNFLEMRSYELYDASVSFISLDESWKVSVFGRNLKDEVYSHFGFDNTAVGSKTIWLAPPRTYGLEVTYNF